MSLGPTGHHSDLRSPKPAVVTNTSCLLLLCHRPQHRSPRIGSITPYLVAMRALSVSGHTLSGGLALSEGAHTACLAPSYDPHISFQGTGVQPGGSPERPALLGLCPCPVRSRPGAGRAGKAHFSSHSPLWPGSDHLEKLVATLAGAWGPGQAVLPSCPYIPQLGQPWQWYRR